MREREKTQAVEAKDVLNQQIAFMRLLYNAAIGDMTDEQFNWTPPGMANSIRASLVHLLNAEDFFVQRVIQGKLRIWEREGWGEKIGLSEPPGRGRNWEEVTEKPLALATVLGYAQAVYAGTDEYMAGLTNEELDRQVRFFGSQHPVADVLATLVTHSTGHLGEISAAKGMQGVKGLPF